MPSSSDDEQHEPLYTDQLERQEAASARARREAAQDAHELDPQRALDVASGRRMLGALLDVADPRTARLLRSLDRAAGSYLTRYSTSAGNLRQVLRRRVMREDYRRQYGWRGGRDRGETIGGIPVEKPDRELRKETRKAERIKKARDAHAEQRFMDDDAVTTGIEAIVAKYVGLGVVDDHSYALAKVRRMKRRGKNRWHMVSWLRAKGVEASLAEQVVNEVEREYASDSDED